MKDLLLVSLRDPYMTSDRVMPPLGIMSLHAYLTEQGFMVDMCNDTDNLSIADVRKYKHIGISCMTPQAEQAKELLRVIKMIDPNIPVIIGGPHADFYTDDCLALDYDYVVRGDGESALKSILTGIWHSRLWTPCPVNLDLLPLPTRTKEFLDDYEFVVQGVKTTTVLTAKGCPNSCAFCENARSRLRLFTPQYVEKQIQQCLDLGYHGIQFYDDLFAISLKRVKELCQIIKPFNIKFRCCGHAKNMTHEMAEVLADAGCIEISYGAESGSQKILNNINKGTTVQQNVEFYQICNAHGIKAKAFMMIGLPGENKDTLWASEMFIHNLMHTTFTNYQGRVITNDYDCTIYFPYRGTHIRDNMQDYDIQIDTTKAQGIFKKHGGISECAVRTKALTREDIMRAQKRILSTYKRWLIC